VVLNFIPVNLAIQNAFGLEFNGSYTLASWRSVNTNFDFYRALTKGDYKGVSFAADTYSWSTRGSFRFKLPQQLNIQSSFNYRAPRITTQGSRKAIYSTDLAISKEILKRNGSLTFRISDVFNSRKYSSITSGPVFYSESDFQWKARQFTMTFSYRINPAAKNNYHRRGSRGLDVKYEIGF
jgi:ferric enterobactin receptor